MVWIFLNFTVCFLNFLKSLYGYHKICALKHMQPHSYIVLSAIFQMNLFAPFIISFHMVCLLLLCITIPLLIICMEILLWVDVVQPVFLKISYVVYTVFACRLSSMVYCLNNFIDFCLDGFCFFAVFFTFTRGWQCTFDPCLSKLPVCLLAEWLKRLRVNCQQVCRLWIDEGHSPVKTTCSAYSERLSTVILKINRVMQLRVDW